jgi:uncharacterized protein (DUF433 family)
MVVGVTKLRALDLYGGHDPRELPVYAIAQAAHHVRVPAVTLASWVHGRGYPTKQGSRRSAPLILTPGGGPTLSWSNLAEAHVLAALRRLHGVPMRNIRSALAFVEKRYDWEHPLIQAEFRTDGVQLFVEELGRTINASQRGQLAIDLALRLDRLEWEDGSGLATALFPLVAHRGEKEPKHVVIDPRRSFGRPIIAGSGVPTEAISERFLAGDSPEHLAGDFHLSLESVLEAIRYESRAAA